MVKWAAIRGQIQIGGSIPPLPFIFPPSHQDGGGEVMEMECSHAHIRIMKCERCGLKKFVCTDCRDEWGCGCGEK